MPLPPPSILPTGTLLALLGAPPARGRAEWLAGRLASLAAEGRLAPGARLPSERELAQALGLSRGTVVRGLDAARDRGVLAARRGSGRTVRAPSAAGPVEALTARAAPLAPGAIDLRATVLPPHPGLAAAAAEVAAQLTADPAWGSAPADGIPALVEQICAHYTRRGLPTSPRQVVVTTGAVSALHLALLAATRTGDRVGTENPGYPNTARVITTGHRRVVPIDVTHDHGGALTEAVASGSLAAAMLTPDFHNPSGTLVGTEDRARLLRAAARTGTSLIIDETLAGMNWRGEAMPPPVAGQGARTLLVGSVSKSLWAGLRIGWVRTADEGADALAHLRLGVDLGAPLFEQQLAARLMAEGGAEGIPHSREHIQRSYGAVTALLAERLPHWRWHPPAGGLSIWASGTHLEARDLVTRAARHGVALSPGALFSPTGTGWTHAVRLPFSGREDELRSALDVLAQVDRRSADPSAPTLTPRRCAAEPAARPR